MWWAGNCEVELLRPQIEKAQFVEFAKQLGSSFLLKLDLCLCSTNAKEHKEDIINNNTISLWESACVRVGVWGGEHHDLHFWLRALPSTRWLTWVYVSASHRSGITPSSLWRSHRLKCKSSSSNCCHGLKHSASRSCTADREERDALVKVRGEVQHLRTAFLVWIALARLWIVLDCAVCLLDFFFF